MKTVFLILVLCLLTSISFAKVIQVPSEYLSIQSAINASESGDTILVSEGTYYENISFRGKGIVVASKFIYTRDWNSVINTIIDGSKAINKDTASTVQFLNNEDSTAVIQGFTITGGTGTMYVFQNKNSKYQEGAGIILSYSSAVIKNNIIKNNGIVPFSPDSRDGGGGGIASMYGNPTIVNNIIVSNNAGYAGGIVLNWSDGTIRNNIIYHNTGRASYGCGGVMLWQSSGVSCYLENNNIIGNISLKDAGGININFPSSGKRPIVKNNIVWGNRQVSGKQVVNPQVGAFNNIEDYSDASNISSYPQFDKRTFQLLSNSPCIDAGDTSFVSSDIEDILNAGYAKFPCNGTVRNDMGTFGGRFAMSMIPVELFDLLLPQKVNAMGNSGKEGVVKVSILNLSSEKIKIDSVSLTNKLVCFPDSAFRGKEIEMLTNDTIYVKFNSPSPGSLSDTLLIYHSLPQLADPARVAISLIIKQVTDVKQDDKPGAFELDQNYPNPFNPKTNIGFRISDFGLVEIKVYDIMGNEITTLLKEEKTAGDYNISFDGSNLSSGIYYYHLKTNDYTATRKMILLK